MLLPSKGRPRISSEITQSAKYSPLEKERKLTTIEESNKVLTEEGDNIEEGLKEEAVAAALERQRSLGLYSLGYMEVKMKSDSQWAKLFGRIDKGCLLFYDSYTVTLRLMLIER
eukprot:TRINITY_DN1220_c0_g1_i12.p1 TRINITY_DN1220_c0_g1~~TRINITY_DN1220_c0_g1_i12.p1  ORF type:complete len:114 (-),score=39.21 TRINITY_DN1220_c0_g1_i12:801-1142(-)